MLFVLFYARCAGNVEIKTHDNDEMWYRAMHLKLLIHQHFHSIHLQQAYKIHPGHLCCKFNMFFK